MARPSNKKEPLLKKHVGTVHISNPLSLLERKLFNVLLFHAYPNFFSQEKYTIKLNLLCDLLGFDSKDYSLIKKALKKLVETTIEWKILANNRVEKEWGIMTFLSGGIIKRGVCEYAYSSFLKEQLCNPEVYARISLDTQRKFQSKYSLALYENCVRFRPVKGFDRGTKFISIEEFKELMGVAHIELYSSYKELNRRIIKPSVKEVNKHSEIIIKPEVKRKGRSISQIRFEVENAPQKKIAEAETSEEELLIIQKFTECGIPAFVVKKWLERFGKEYLLEKYLYLQNQLSLGKIKENLGGYLAMAVQDNYQEISNKDFRNILPKKETKEDPNKDKKIKEKKQKLYEEQRKENEAKKYLENLNSEELTKLEKEFVQANNDNVFMDKNKYPVAFMTGLTSFAKEKLFH